MAGLAFFCCSDQRRAALQKRPALNGIDYLEVEDLAPAELGAVEAAEYATLPANQRDRLLWQRRLTVFFVNPLLPDHLAALSAANFRIEGGERADTRNIGVTVLATTTDAVVLRATRRGDFSTYRLQIVTSDAELTPPAVFDPVLAAVDFSFKVECPSEFDCAAPRVCPPAVRPAIDLDYLARDYASFRALMLDRIAALAPEWRERHAADLGITLVELVAYVADYLSYRQDAIATEAYLGTARKRISVRRHARLVDYPMHDGCNARVWVQVVLDADAPPSGISLPHTSPVSGATTKFLTKVAAPPTLDDARGAEVMATRHPEVFEILTDPTAPEPHRLFPQHNRLHFYAWGSSECCLPKGATRATLDGRFDDLAPGDVLILEEILGPKTGVPGDADPAHRHAVRLTSVAVAEDPLGGEFRTPPTSDAVPITEIEWSSDDALPFALCVSATIEGENDTQVPTTVSVASGNIVPASHGVSVVERLPDTVPAPKILRPAADAGPCSGSERTPVPARFTPTLARRPLTHEAPYSASRSARSAMQRDVGRAMPRIRLESAAPVQQWTVRRDLLGSGGTSRDFVVEIESDGAAQLRFGDDSHGVRPRADTAFTAFYRVGNGARGNVGAESIAHIVTSVAGIAAVRNPLPAIGGVDPERVEDVRRFAPVAFRTQERAVTADDYARMAERHPQVQQAAATMRWTGSWRTVFVTVDPFAKDRDVRFDPGMPEQLEPYRMAGHDLEVDTPRYVPLEIDVEVCARRTYFRSEVKRALADVLGSRVLADGRKGVFHPDNFTFGQPVFLSRVYAAAYAVDGVESVKITKFQRQGSPDPGPLEKGKLDFGRLEIARLDNDANFPNRGVLRLRVAGGK